VTTRRLVLWRHGQTAWNARGVFQGQLDVELDDLGRQQAKEAAPYVARYQPTVIVTSDLSRAAETARCLTELTGVTAQPDPALRETHVGDWQGRGLVDIKATDGERYRAWRAGKNVLAGGGESRADVAERASRAIDALWSEALWSEALWSEALPEVTDGDKSAKVTIVAVTHGGTARSVTGCMLGLAVEQWSALGGLENCRWSVLEEALSGWRLVEHNVGVGPCKL
jgi:glucosyl-3-phosphoglycerate phosphatase